MAGNKAGGLIAKSKLLAKDPDHYRKIGAKGGSTKPTRPRGFAAMDKQRLSELGRKGGSVMGYDYGKK